MINKNRANEELTNAAQGTAVLAGLRSRVGPHRSPLSLPVGKGSKVLFDLQIKSEKSTQKLRKGERKRYVEVSVNVT